MRKFINKSRKFVRSARFPAAVLAIVISGAASAQTASYDVADALLYVTGLLAVIGTVGVAWVSVSYLKKGWKALRGA